MLNKKNKFTRKIFVEDLDMRNVRVDGSQTSGAQLKEEGSWNLHRSLEWTWKGPHLLNNTTSSDKFAYSRMPPKIKFKAAKDKKLVFLRRTEKYQDKEVTSA